MFSNIEPSPQEISAILPGDDIVPNATVIMDRAFTLPGRPETIWPWFMQLGKNRAGWYFPAWVEKFFIPGKRGIRQIDPALQNLQVGSVIDDWGGKDATFTVALLHPPNTLVHTSTRGKTHLSWAIFLREQDQNTRVQLRLRLAPVKYRWLANSVGGLLDKLTVAGLAAGLDERLRGQT